MLVQNFKRLTGCIKFSPEAEVWYGIPEFDVLAINISVPGLSMLYPDVHCTVDGEICQLTTGESGTYPWMVPGSVS